MLQSLARGAVSKRDKVMASLLNYRPFADFMGVFEMIADVGVLQTTDVSTPPVLRYHAQTTPVWKRSIRPPEVVFTASEMDLLESLMRKTSDVWVRDADCADGD